jgi:hypothetical protein
MSNTVLTVFIVVTALAVVLQACILLAMAVAARKTQTRVLAIAEELRGHLGPILTTTRQVLEDSAPKIKTITANLEETSHMVRVQTIHINHAIDDILARGREHAQRVDGMVDDTLDKVEHARQTVNRITDGPIRWVNAMSNGVRAAVDRFLQQRRPVTDFSASESFEEEEIFD